MKTITLIFCLLASIATAQGTMFAQMFGQQSGILPSPYLVAGYRLDGNAMDMSGNGKNGTLLNDPTYTEGKYGSAISLNSASNQYITSSAIVTSYPFTVCAWKKKKTTTLGHIFSFENSVSGIIYYTASSESQNKITSRNNALTTETGVSTDNTNEWCHISVVWKNNTQRLLYFNGVYDFSLPTTNTIAMDANINKFIIGLFRTGTQSGWFNGVIDEVYIFNKELSSNDIVRVMNNQNPTYQ